MIFEQIGVLDGFHHMYKDYAFAMAAVIILLVPVYWGVEAERAWLCFSLTNAKFKRQVRVYQNTSSALTKH